MTAESSVADQKPPHVQVTQRCNGSMCLYVIGFVVRYIWQFCLSRTTRRTGESGVADRVASE